MKELLKNNYVRYGLALLIGMAIGAIFYPSKTITSEERTKFEQAISTLEYEKKVTQEFYQGQYDEEVQSNREYREEISRNTETLREENFKLKQRVSEKRFKIVRPDGTIEERWFKESETDVISSTVTKIKEEFTRKVTSIERKWMKIHEKRIRKIKEDYEKKLAANSNTRSETFKKTKTEINKRSFGISLGITSEKNYFSSVTYDIFGPMFLDLHLESDKHFDDKEIGLGIGIRF